MSEARHCRLPLDTGNGTDNTDDQDATTPSSRVCPGSTRRSPGGRGGARGGRRHAALATMQRIDPRGGGRIQAPSVSGAVAPVNVVVAVEGGTGLDDRPFGGGANGGRLDGWRPLPVEDAHDRPATTTPSCLSRHAARRASLRVIDVVLPWVSQPTRVAAAMGKPRHHAECRAVRGGDQTAMAVGLGVSRSATPTAAVGIAASFPGRPPRTLMPQLPLPGTGMHPSRCPRRGGRRGGGGKGGSRSIQEPMR